MMDAHQWTGPQAGIQLRVEREQVEVTSNAPRRDPNWRFTDAKGHEHHLDGHGWPTLQWVIDETYWCADCRDEHDDGHWECRECGEHISPGMLGPSGVREFLPGIARYYLNDREVTKEEAEAAVNAAAAVRVAPK